MYGGDLRVFCVFLKFLLGFFHDCCSVRTSRGLVGDYKTTQPTPSTGAGASVCSTSMTVGVRAIPRPLRFKYLCLSSLQVRAIDNIALKILFKGRRLGFGGLWKLSDTTLLKNLSEKT